MNLRHIVVATATMWFGSPVQAQPVWLTDQFLDAIRQVESGGNNNAVSPKGAAGPYQFMPATWAEWGGGYPFEMASDPQIARAACKRYYIWIDATITKWQGHPATRDQCCGAYNAGVGTLRRVKYDTRKLPIESVQYVNKVNIQIRKQEAHDRAVEAGNN